MGRSEQSGGWEGKQVFTTGEAAEVCNLSQQTIIRCFDNGRLSGFRVPGSRFRRIPREDLICFMQENNIPTEALTENGRRILVIAPDSKSIGVVINALASDQGLNVEVANSEFDAGVLSEQFRPHVVLIGSSLRSNEIAELCGRIKSTSSLEDPKVLVMGDELPNDVRVYQEHRVDGFVEKPFDSEKLLIRVNQLFHD